MRLALCLWALLACAREVPVKEPCTVRMADGGLVTAVLATGEITGRLAGARLDPAKRADVEAVLGRLPAGRTECTVDATTDPPRITVTYFAWQDKAGDVYEDLAVTLAKIGLATKE